MMLVAVYLWTGKGYKIFLADGHENINKMSCFVGQEYSRVLQVTERGLGTRAPSYKTVCGWMNAIKNSQEERDNALTVKPQHR